MPEKKMCPIISKQDERYTCKEEDCALWNSVEEKCVLFCVRDIADLLRSTVQAIDRVELGIARKR